MTADRHIEIRPHELGGIQVAVEPPLDDIRPGAKFEHHVSAQFWARYLNKKWGWPIIDKVAA